MPKPIIAVRIPQELYDKAKEKAEREDITLSQVVRRYLREWIAEEDKQHREEDQEQK